MTEHEKRCRRWGIERNLLNASTPGIQMVLVIEETSEFLEYHVSRTDNGGGVPDEQRRNRRIKGMKDSIGDARVFMIQCCSFYSFDFHDCDNEATKTVDDFIPGDDDVYDKLTAIIAKINTEVTRAMMAIESGDSVDLKQRIGNINRGFLALIPDPSMIDECDQIAWDSIKDRQGMFINKKFVKEQDFTPEQRQQFHQMQRNNKMYADKMLGDA